MKVLIQLLSWSTLGAYHLLLGILTTLENHCTQTAQSSCGGCSRQVHKIVYQAVKKGIILVNIFSFSYCTHSSIYRVFWPSGLVVDCNILILFKHLTNGPEHPIYRTMCTVWKAWITFKMLCAQIKNFVHIKGLGFCILSKVSINSRT